MEKLTPFLRSLPLSDKFRPFESQTEAMEFAMLANAVGTPVLVAEEVRSNVVAIGHGIRPETSSQPQQGRRHQRPRNPHPEKNLLKNREAIVAANIRREIERVGELLLKLQKIPSGRRTEVDTNHLASASHLQRIWLERGDVFSEITPFTDPRVIRMLSVLMREEIENLQGVLQQGVVLNGSRGDLLEKLFGGEVTPEQAA